MQLVVCHDAGGAEILSSWLRRRGDTDFACVLDGPARGVFARKLGAVPEMTLEAGMTASDSLLCGTSWQSTLEFDALALARERGIRSFSFLDHWINYRERFQHGGATHLPDEFWVGDQFALALAQVEFPGSIVRLVGNPYFDEIRESVSALPPRSPIVGSASVLFVCEPVSEFGHMPGDSRSVGYDEHEALAYLLRNLGSLGVNVERVVVRPHPSEPVGKYAWAIGFEGLPVVPGGDGSLLEEIAACDIVAGIESMAMVVGLMAGRRVVSCIPPQGRDCVLPFPEIERLAG